MYMRHYIGDWDNYSQSYSDNDTKWAVHETETEGAVHIKNPTRAQGENYLSLHDDGKLYVPNTGEMTDAARRLWRIIQVDRPDFNPQVAPGTRVVTLRHQQSGKYAGVRPAGNWQLNDSPEPFLVVSREDGSVHFKHQGNGLSFRHYNGDWDCFTQQGHDNDTEFFIEGDEKTGCQLVNRRRGNGSSLAPDASIANQLRCPVTSEQGDSAIRQWILEDASAGDMYAAAEAAAEAKKSAAPAAASAATAEVELKRTGFHFADPASRTCLLHSNGGPNQGTQGYPDYDTEWHVSVYADNKVKLKHAKENRWLVINQAGQLLAENDLSEAAKYWTLVDEPVVEAAAGPETKYFSIFSAPEYMMHHDNRSITTQNYIDGDTVWEAKSENGKWRLRNKHGRFLTSENGQLVTDGPRPDDSQLFTITDTAAVEEKKDDDDVPANFSDRKVGRLITKLMSKQLRPGSNQAKEFDAVMSAIAGGLKLAGREVAEVTAMHVRRLDGHGFTVTQRNLAVPSQIGKFISTNLVNVGGRANSSPAIRSE